MISHLCLLLAIVTAFGEEARFTSEEIESLVSKNAWGEAILHLPEVATGDRGKSWDGLVERVAVGYLRSLSEVDLSSAMVMGDTLQKSYPSLQRSGTYHDAIHAIAYSGFKSCFEQKESQSDCTKNLREYFTRRLSSVDRANSRFCKDAVMSRSLGELCPTRKSKRQGGVPNAQPPSRPSTP